jgi:hypothetical protein
MTQYLLALYRDHAVPVSPEKSRQVWADVNSLDDALEWAKLTTVAEQRPIEVRPLFDGDLGDAIQANASDAQ